MLTPPMMQKCFAAQMNAPRFLSFQSRTAAFITSAAT